MRVPGRLIVFNTHKPDRSDDSNDPDFRGLPFSWGICRPELRRAVEAGEYLFFVARDQEGWSGLYLKGFFRVAENISVAEALARQNLRSRQNVIIDELPPNREVRSALADYWEQHGCPGPNAQRRRHGKHNARTVPTLEDATLGSWIFEDGGRTFVHRSGDYHEADDGRCGRIFNCRIKQRDACLQAGGAPVCTQRSKAGVAQTRGYIVGDERDCASYDSPPAWEDVVRSLGTEYDALVRKCFTCRGRNSIPYGRLRGQVNALKLAHQQVTELRDLCLSRQTRAA